MTPSSRISPDEFLALSDLNQRLSDEDRLAYLKHSSFYVGKEDSFDCAFEHSHSADKPSRERVDEFIISNGSLNNAMTSVRSVTGARSKHDLNWCSIEDYLDNWHLLSKDDQLSLRMLVLADNHTNANRFGVKNRNLESHLLLSLGCDMSNILNTPKDAVRSNLKSPGGDYSRLCVDNRAVDAKTCLRSLNKFNRTYSVEKLFKLGLVAYQAVIVSDESYRKVNGIDSKKQYHKFYRENASFLSNLCMKQKKIMSYFYSHELSVDSILGAQYRPHSHVIFFLPREEFCGALDPYVESLEETFNSQFNDRTLTILRSDTGAEALFNVSRNYKDIERSFSYLHRAYSLSDQYMREIRETNVRELNNATVECYHNLIWLLKTSTGESKGVRRVGSGYIPKVKDLEKYEHPLLQKRKKNTKIKNKTLGKPKNPPCTDDSINTNHVKVRSRRPSKGCVSCSTSNEEQNAPEALCDPSAVVSVLLANDSLEREALGRSKRKHGGSSKLRIVSGRVRRGRRQTHVSGHNSKTCSSTSNNLTKAGNDRRTVCMGRNLRRAQKARSKRRLPCWNDERSRGSQPA